MHFSFEQLQTARSQRDIIGVVILTDKIVSNALWMSMELRQKIMNAGELDLEADLCHPCGSFDDASGGEESSPTQGASPDLHQKSRGKMTQSNLSSICGAEEERGNWDYDECPPCFQVPRIDCMKLHGGTPQSILDAYHGKSHIASHTSHVDSPKHLPASLFPKRLHSAARNGQNLTATYTKFPPFRFAVEFPNPRTLRVKRRVYSPTFWYAGSLWNVYIQKMDTPQQNELGV